jgi:hypothetical protein
MKKSLFRNLPSKPTVGFWLKLQQRLAYARVEMKQGNFAAWITANTAAWILAQAVGRLNRRKEWSQATNVCFCISTLHAMCSVASSTATEANTIFFYTPYSKRLHGFISKLGNLWAIGL